MLCGEILFENGIEFHEVSYKVSVVRFKGSTFIDYLVFYKLNSKYQREDMHDPTSNLFRVVLSQTGSKYKPTPGSDSGNGRAKKLDGIQLSLDKTYPVNYIRLHEAFNGCRLSY